MHGELKKMNSIKVKAYAKINWALNITGEAPNGYHLLDMLMQSISLHDTLTINKDEAQGLCIIGSNELTCSDDNLIIKAKKALEEYTGSELNCSFILEKNIPLAAGLAGGSADAAAALAGMNAVFELGLTPSELLRVAEKIGSDVPFFMYGGFQRATGTGTELKRLRNPEKIHMLIIKPCEGLSTAEVYKNSKTDTSACVDDAVNALQEGRIQDLKACCANALFKPASDMRPEINTAIEKLYQSGAVFAAMSGSGPSVFGVFESEDSARIAKDMLKAEYDEIHLASTHVYGLEFV